MKTHHCFTKPFKYLFTIGVFTMSFYMTGAHAQLIDTETLINHGQPEQIRNHIQDTLDREEVKTKMHALGVAPETIQARVDSLTTVEIQALANDIDALPAGGAIDNVTLLLIIIIIILLV